MSRTALPTGLELSVAGAGATVAIDPVTGGGDASLTLGQVAALWPHTHGEPALHDVALRAGDDVRYRGRVGFRRLEAPADLEADRLSLRINDVPVFARGAVWTPGDLRADRSGSRPPPGRRSLPATPAWGRLSRQRPDPTIGPALRPDRPPVTLLTR